MLRIIFSPYGAIEELLRGGHSKVALMDREAIEYLLSIQKLSRWIEKLSRQILKIFDRLKLR